MSTSQRCSRQAPAEPDRVEQVKARLAGVPFRFKLHRSVNDLGQDEWEAQWEDPNCPDYRWKSAKNTSKDAVKNMARLFARKMAASKEAPEDFEVHVL